MSSIRYTLLLSGLAAACAAPQRSDRVRFADGLETAVVAGSPRASRTPDKLLRVVVPLHNVADEDLVLLVQVVFLDAAGNRYNDETPRRVFRLTRGQQREFASTSMTSNAVDFVVHVARN